MPAIEASDLSDTQNMRFTIRSLLLVVTVLAIVCWILDHATHNYRKRHRIEKDFISMGAYYVGFDEHSNPDYVSFMKPISSPRIGNYQSIRHLDLSGAHITDRSIRHIAKLKSVFMLHLNDTDITDDQLVLLGDIGSLQLLRLNGSQVTDDAIAAIAEIDGLIAVDLSGTRVTTEGAAELQRLVPGITIRR